MHASTQSSRLGTAHCLKGVCCLSGQVLVMSAYMTPNQDMAFVTAVSYVTLGSVVAGFMCRISNMVRAALSHKCVLSAAPPLLSSPAWRCACWHPACRLRDFPVCSTCAHALL